VERWRRIKADEVESKGGSCADCGGVFHPDVFDFHHTNPAEKEYQWAKLRLFSAKRRRVELAKCVLLCANCHRLRHT
jgi:5-methylcytosine-specific restriction endonuclease McrA